MDKDDLENEYKKWQNITRDIRILTMEALYVHFVHSKTIGKGNNEITWTKTYIRFLVFFYHMSRTSTAEQTRKLGSNKEEMYNLFGKSLPKLEKPNNGRDF